MRHRAGSVGGDQADPFSYANFTFESEKKWSAVPLLFQKVRRSRPTRAVLAGGGCPGRVGLRAREGSGSRRPPGRPGRAVGGGNEITLTLKSDFT